MSDSDNETFDYLDILEKLKGPVGEVIARLQELHAQYPDGVIEIGQQPEYGEWNEYAHLEFTRPKTTGEVEYERLAGLENEYRQCLLDLETMRRFGKPDDVKRLERRAERLREQLGKLVEPAACLVMMDDWPAVRYMSEDLEHGRFVHIEPCPPNPRTTENTDES